MKKSQKKYQSERESTRQGIDMVQIPSCQVREERDRRKDKTQKDPSPDVWEGIISGKCIRQSELNPLVKIPSPHKKTANVKEDPAENPPN